LSVTPHSSLLQAVVIPVNWGVSRPLALIACDIFRRAVVPFCIYIFTSLDSAQD